MDINPRTNEDEAIGNDDYVDKHPALSVLIFIALLIVINFATTFGALTLRDMIKGDSSASFDGNDIRIGEKCLTVSNAINESADISSDTQDLLDVGEKPAFQDSMRVVRYEFTVESKENIYDGLIECNGEECMATVDTETGYTLKINLANDTQDYYKLYDSLKVGHKFSCNVRPDNNSFPGMYAIIVDCIN